MDSRKPASAGGHPSAQVLIAPDKFKGSLSAHQVASAIARGIRSFDDSIDVDLCPVADGGEGTLDAAVSAGFRRLSVEVDGPTGERLAASYGERDGIALVELADAVGIRRLVDNQLAPMTASTYGAGQLVEAAILAGNRTIILAIGGSSSSDGGAGLVQALGAKLTDVHGNPLGRGGGSLVMLDRIDLAPIKERWEGVKFVIASDVDNPLLGPKGAATVFGPQKGASPREVEVLERGLAKWASIVAAATGKDATECAGAGAAGGVGYGAITVLGATIVRGADVVLDMVRFAERLRRAKLVVTGEGSLDEQTLFGKAPLRVADASRAAGVPAVAVVGQCLLADEALTAMGIHRVYSLQEIEPDMSRSIAHASALVERMGERIARTELAREASSCP